MKMDFDVVIVGLGPTGGTLANLLAMNDLSVLHMVSMIDNSFG